MHVQALQTVSNSQTCLPEVMRSHRDLPGGLTSVCVGKRRESRMHNVIMCTMLRFVHEYAYIHPRLKVTMATNRPQPGRILGANVVNLGQFVSLRVTILAW